MSVNLDEDLSKFLEGCLGMSLASLKKSSETDSDWSLIIKLHAYVEASLNFLIVKHFGDNRLEDIVAYLDTSDRRRGKLAFVKALDLLPSEYRSFIQKFSELRNELAHDVKNIDFDLKAYVEKLADARFQELADSIIPLQKDILDEFWIPKTREKQLNMIKTAPRDAFLLGVGAVMLRVYEKHQVRDLLTGEKSEPPESSPKVQ